MTAHRLTKLVSWLQYATAVYFALVALERAFIAYDYLTPTPAFTVDDAGPIPFAIFLLADAAVPVLAAIYLLFVASWLRQRRRYSLCLVAAGLTCIAFPWGTAAGLVTLLCLGSQRVRNLFHGTAPLPSVACA